MAAFTNTAKARAFTGQDFVADGVSLLISKKVVMSDVMFFGFLHVGVGVRWDPAYRHMCSMLDLYCVRKAYCEFPHYSMGVASREVSQ